MKYALFNSEGDLETCLVAGLHDIPANAIELSEELFFQITQETDGQWMIDEEGGITKRPLPAMEQDLTQLIAQARFDYETSGFTFDGLSIKSTRDSQALIANAGLSALIDSDYRCNFKTATGFVETDAAQIIEIAKAVRAHVQACFDRELALLRAIESGEYRDEMLTEGWPDSMPPTRSDSSPTQPR